MELKIGILLPRSDMFPALSLDFLNGLKLSLLKNLKGNNFKFKYIVEGLGNAADDTILRVAEKMILQEEVVLTITFCSFFKLNELISIFNAYKKPLIHLDLGGNVLNKEHTSPFVLHHTLNLWQSAYASGVYTANNFGKKAALAISFYDGGYHLTSGFVQGFTDQGGEIVFSYVSPMDYKSETFENMIHGIKESEADVVFTLFSYKEGIKVFETLSKSELNGNISFMAFPLMTDEKINTKDYKIKDVFSIASWAFDEDSLAMKKFLSDFKTTYEKDPNIFNLLGYEIGTTVSHCLQEDGSIVSEIKTHLNTKTIDSPRGELTYNKYNESEISDFKLRKFNYNNIKYHNTVIETLDTKISDKTYQKFEDLPLSGWKNPYICT